MSNETRFALSTFIMALASPTMTWPGFGETGNSGGDLDTVLIAATPTATPSTEAAHRARSIGLKWRPIAAWGAPA
jgi:hypothetical protein